MAPPIETVTNGNNESYLNGINGYPNGTNGLNGLNGPSDLNGLNGLSDLNGLNGNNHGTNGHTNGDYPKPPTSNTPFTPIAICGMACRLPGNISSPSALWDFLLSGRDARAKVPASRFNIDGFYSRNKRPGTLNTEYGYFLDSSVDLAGLDNTFFSMGRTELEWLDPQQRMLLEVSRESLDDAGEVGWKGKNIGVYAGTFTQDWYDMMVRDGISRSHYAISTSNDFMVSERVSHELDLRGPSLTIRTACSSALTGLNEACMAIGRGDCESALVGGTNLILSPDLGIRLADMGVLSPDGSCKTFSAEANGYARGEAIVSIYIKSLDAALRDGNPIRSVIRGTAANFDGKTNPLTMPSAEMQEALIRRAYDVAGIDSISKTGLFECHGTGTKTGDPLETEAIASVFGQEGIHLGALKPNLGHSEGASGLTAVLKAVLALEHKTIPPNIKYSPLNPKIPFGNAKLLIPEQPTQWPTGRDERVSINSFGVGGANAHVIVESAASFLAAKGQEPTKKKPSNYPQLLLFSANTPQSLKEMERSYQSLLNSETPLSVSDIAYTLANRREHLKQRSFAVATKDKLELSTFISSNSKASAAPPLVMVFTGQGAAWPQFGRELLRHNAVFAGTFENLDEHLRRLGATWTLKEELLKPTRNSRVYEAEFAQPLCTALQLALVDTLASVGVKPSAVVGHSSGEIGAAYAAGALTAREAIAVAYHRGASTKGQTERGGMAAIGLSWEEAHKFVVPGVVVACDNSPSSVTLSGDADKLEAVLASVRLRYPDSPATMLKVEKAYHSHHMAVLSSAYHKAMVDSGVVGRVPEIQFFSSVSGKIIGNSKGDLLGPSYWTANLERPVLFKSAVTAILEMQKFQDSVLLELGPHSALAGPLRQILTSQSSKAVYVPSLARRQNSIENFLQVIGKLHICNLAVDFKTLMADGNCIPDLPSYPWDHSKRFWHESRFSQDWRGKAYPDHVLLGTKLVESTDDNPAWRNLLSVGNVPWVLDHKLRETIVFPLSGFVAVAAEAARQVSGLQGGVSFRNLTVSNALVLSEDSSVEILTNLSLKHLTDSTTSDWFDFTISSHNGHVWTRHCFGVVRGVGSETVLHAAGNPPSLPRKVESAKWYEAERRGGLYYGPNFAGLQQITSATGSSHEATATVKNNKWTDTDHYHLHPAVLDHFIQLQILSVYNGMDRDYKRLLGSKIEAMTILRCVEEDLNIHATSKPSGEGYVGNGTITANGKTVAQISGNEIVLFDETDGPSDIDDIPLTARSEWVPHVDFQPIGDLIKPVEGSELFVPLLDELARAAITVASRSIADIKVQTPHLVQYKEWIMQQAAESASSVDSLVEKLQGTPAAHVANTITTLSANLETVLRGEKTALSVLTLNGGIDSLAQLLREQDDSKYLRSLAHTKPNLRVLELGAGLSQRTSSIVQCLTRVDGQSLYSQYVVSDASAGLMNVVEERLKGTPNMKFAVFDINANLPLESGPFDLIIAANVINACSDVEKSLRNLRDMLAPGGRLLLEEPKPGLLWAKFILATLPGWWAHSEATERAQEPFISSEEWQRELLTAGFADYVQAKSDAEDWTNNVFVAKQDKAKGQSRRVTLLLSSKETAPGSLVRELENRNYEVDYTNLDQTPPSGQDVIALLEEEQPFFESMDGPTLARLKAFLNNLVDAGLIWITKPSSIGVTDPRFAQTIGLIRSVRGEMALDVATMETKKIETAGDAVAVADVLVRFGSREDDEVLGPDYEYVFHGGQTLVNRIFPFSLDKEYAVSNSGNEAIMAQSQPGRLDSLGWVAYDAKEPVDDEVEVEVHASGLNFRDVLVGMKLIPGRHDPRFGYEGAGFVRRVGPKVQGLATGDRVVVIGIDTFATVVKGKERMVKKLPDDISFIQGASLPLAFITAVYCLKELGRLSHGQSVLIHSGTGGVGLAAIQVAHMLGAEVYVTVGNEKKVQYLVDNCGISRGRIFNSRNTSFVDDLRRATGGQGVDVALNSLAGELLHATWRCIAPWGTMIEIGKRDMLGGAQLDMKPFLENRIYCCCDVEQMRIERPDISSRTLHFVMDCFSNGTLKPLPVDRVFGASAVLESFRYMQQGKHIGKIVVEIRAEAGESLVKNVNEAKKASLSFDGGASYLLIGGLGGLGRSIAEWMVERGARHLTLMSRSAGKGTHHADLAAELQSMGCNVQLVPGDVTNADDVAQAVAGMSAPLKGVVQMSMILRDQMFEGMSIEDWNAVVDPKVAGTWNLHNATKSLDLDFFLMFSSLSGVLGQVGQANYASANTFLDAFVQYRASLGLPSTSIDLGAMEGIGYLSENQELLRKMQGTGWRLVQENELLRALELAMISPSVRGPDERGSQLPLGNAFLLGFVPTVPLSNPDSSARLRRDRRMAVYHNVGGSNNKARSATDGLPTLISAIKTDPSVLESTETKNQLAVEIGKKLLGLVLAGDTEVDICMRTADLGLDSLVAVEMLAWWRVSFGFEVSTLEMMSMGTLEALGKRAAHGLMALHG